MFISFDLELFADAHDGHETGLPNHVLEDDLVVGLGQQVEPDHASHCVLGLALPALLRDRQTDLQFDVHVALFELQVEFGVVQPGLVHHLLLVGVEVQMAPPVRNVRFPSSDHHEVLILVQTVQFHWVVAEDRQFVVAIFVWCVQRRDQDERAFGGVPVEVQCAHVVVRIGAFLELVRSFRPDLQFSLD